MIESLHIRNFRCFRDATISGLRRINVIVGRNASGKTALLESVFLTSSGNPQIVLKLRALRGMGQDIAIETSRLSYESLWNDLFYSERRDSIITIDLVGSAPHTRSLSIFYDRPTAPTLPFGTEPVEPPSLTPIVFKWATQSSEVVLKPALKKEGLNFGGVIESVPAWFCTSSFVEPQQPIAQRFSELSRTKKDGPVIESLRREYPFVEGVSIEFSAGAPMLHAAIAGLAEKVPLPLVSAGISKLLAMLVGIAHASGGVVLIDEIENGFFHDRYASVWRLVLRFAKESDTQIFATVHSRECLEALGQAIADNEEAFCLLRTELENGEVTIASYSGVELAGAVEHGFEVR